MSKLLIQHQIDSDFNLARCSKCQNTFIKSSMTKYNYCPICGCKIECEGYSNNKQFNNKIILLLNEKYPDINFEVIKDDGLYTILYDKEIIDNYDKFVSNIIDILYGKIDNKILNNLSIEYDDFDEMNND